MQFQKRTISVFFSVGLVCGLILVVLWRGIKLYQEEKLSSSPERYREVYRNTLIIDTNILEARKSYVHDGAIAVVRYPKTAYPAVNRDIEKFIDERVASFVSSSEDGIGEFAPKDTLFITYASSTIPGYAVSFLFRLSAVYGGSLHPDDEIISRSYDLGLSAPLMLENIFSDVSFGIREVARMVATDLLSRSEFSADEDRTLRATTATIETYKNFTLGPNSITFYFSPHQIGQSAAGIISSEIPYMQIRDLLRGEFLAKVKL